MPMTLREARRKRGWTQEVLAARSGVDQPTISRLENGGVQSPSWDTVAKLCKALAMRPEAVFPVDMRRAS